MSDEPRSRSPTGSEFRWYWQSDERGRWWYVWFVATRQWLTYVTNRDNLRQQPNTAPPISQGVNLHQAPLRGKENSLVHREASFRNECMLVNTVDPSIRVVQQTFRHSTVVLHMPTKQTSADAMLWTVS